MKATSNKVAIAPFLCSCPEVTTLGIRATLDEYSEEERNLLRSAERIFFPTSRFVGVFHAAGRRCFPSYFTYRYRHSRILQFTLFNYLQQPFPRTRFYFGERQKAKISKDFQFPFILMGPQVKPETRRFIPDDRSFGEHAGKYNPVIVQEYVEWSERIRMVCVHLECLAAYRQTSRSSGKSAWEPIPTEHTDYTGIFEQTHRLLIRAQIDDIAVEWVCVDGSWQLLEMKKPPVHMRSLHGPISRHEHICCLIQRGAL